VSEVTGKGYGSSPDSVRVIGKYLPDVEYQDQKYPFDERVFEHNGGMESVIGIRNKDGDGWMLIWHTVSRSTCSITAIRIDCILQLRSVTNFWLKRVKLFDDEGRIEYQEDR
jgi:hypothetical protein